MSRSRNLWALLGLASLLGIVVFGLWRRGAIRPVAVPQPKEVQPVSTEVSTEVHFRDEVRKLEPEHPIEAELKGGEGDRYEVDLQVGQFVHLVADQRGIDVTLRLKAPDGATILEVDSPTGNMGPEHAFAIAEAAGAFRVEVFSTDPSSPAGRYEAKLDAPHTATEADRKHVRAFKLFAEGDLLIQQGGQAAKSQSLPKF